MHLVLLPNRNYLFCLSLVRSVDFQNRHDTRILIAERISHQVGTTQSTHRLIHDYEKTEKSLGWHWMDCHLKYVRPASRDKTGAVLHIQFFLFNQPLALNDIGYTSMQSTLFPLSIRSRS